MTEADLQQLPVLPVGWRILIEPVEIKRQTDSGIALPEEVIKAQQHLRYIGKVVAMGPLCYAKDDFKVRPGDSPSYPFCKVGDWVAFGKYAGQEVIGKREGKATRYKLVNDDEVLAVVQDPDFIETPM